MGTMTLEQLRADGAAGYPRHALRDSETALCLFAAAFGGKQDAAWLAEAGLQTTCVDVDAEALLRMREVYPDSWEWEPFDAFTFARSARATGRKWDVVSLDPFTGSAMERCLEELETICALATDVVVLGCTFELEVAARDCVPDGWQIVDVRRRSDFQGGTYWIVLQPTGVGVDPRDVTACLVTRGDQPEMIDRILETLPYGDVRIWDNSREWDYATAGRYAAAFDCGASVVYFQDDDTIFRHHEELCRAYNPGGITAVYGHGETPAGYGDLPLVCGGGLADVAALRRAVDEWKDGIGCRRFSPEENAYADFAIGVLTPFRHVFLPFEIVLEVAQHPSRLCNQEWAAEAKARVTAAARAIRDAR